MAKQNLTVSKKTEGTFIRLTDDFKKKAKIFAIEQGTTLTQLIIDAVEEKISRTPR